MEYPTLDDVAKYSRLSAQNDSRSRVYQLFGLFPRGAHCLRGMPRRRSSAYYLYFDWPAASPPFRTQQGDQSRRHQLSIRRERWDG
jgi:hypothetical protein